MRRRWTGHASAVLVATHTVRYPPTARASASTEVAYHPDVEHRAPRFVIGLVLCIVGAACGDEQPESTTDSIAAPSSNGSSPSATTTDSLPATTTATWPLVVERRQITDDEQQRLGSGGESRTILDYVRIEIYTTDPQQVEAALDAIGSEARDRIDVKPAVYSANELASFIQQAEAALTVAGVEVGWISSRFDVGHLEVLVTTADGLPDAELESKAEAALDGIPVMIGFMAPMQPLSG